MAQNFYCEYCGAKYSSIASLTNGYCLKHPNGPNKGKHKLYEGLDDEGDELLFDNDLANDNLDNDDDIIE